MLADLKAISDLGVRNTPHHNPSNLACSWQSITPTSPALATSPQGGSPVLCFEPYYLFQMSVTSLEVALDRKDSKAKAPSRI